MTKDDGRHDKVTRLDRQQPGPLGGSRSSDHRVAAEKALPFDVKVPNPTTVKAMRAAGRGRGKRLKSAGALFKDLGI